MPNSQRYWEFECDCKNTIITSKYSVLNNTTKSCGCLKRKQSQINGKQNKKYNTYDLSGDYGIGYATNGEEFYFDLEDHDVIKNYCWGVNSDGYPSTRLCGSTLRLHKLITNTNVDELIDHIDRNKKNCRKENLRSCNKSQNCSNINLRSDNTSDVIGVVYRNKTSKWIAQIQKNHKNKHIGCFTNKEDAIKARLEAEKKYFGEFAPQQHLYELYGIVVEEDKIG